MTTADTIRSAVANLGQGPLTEQGLAEHVHPLFSRVLERNARSGEIYLANHSLGRPLDATADDVQEALNGWYEQLDGVWPAWLKERDAYRAKIARLIGRGDPKAVVPKSSVAQALRAVLNAMPAQPPRVVTTRGEFDSVDFVLKAYAHRGRCRVDWVACDKSGRFDPNAVIRAIEPGVDLVVVSRVFFATGQVLERIEDIIARALEVGARVLVDAYHAAGVIPDRMDEMGCDAMMGGSYKYTRGGAGACWLALADSMLSGAGVPEPDEPASLDTGWFAKDQPFAYRRTDLPEYASGGDAWLEATPPILTYYQARAGLELTLALGVDRLRAYSLGQLAFLREQLQARGVQTTSMNPEPGGNGAYLLVPVADGHEAAHRIKQAGVNCDARPSPAADASESTWFVRFCPDILNTRAELEAAADRVAGALAGSAT